MLRARRALRDDAADGEGVEGQGSIRSAPGQRAAGSQSAQRKPQASGSLYTPGAHTQVNTSTTPSCAWLEFAGHASHGSARCPGALVFCHVLAPQGSQAVRPGSRATLPLAQASQVSRLAAPTLAENLPGAQASQSEELAASA